MTAEVSPLHRRKVQRKTRVGASWFGFSGDDGVCEGWGATQLLLRQEMWARKHVGARPCMRELASVNTRSYFEITPAAGADFSRGGGWWHRPRNYMLFNGERWKYFTMWLVCLAAINAQKPTGSDHWAATYFSALLVCTHTTMCYNVSSDDDQEYNEQK